MRLYHTTTDEQADAILAHGFKDAEGSYLTTGNHRGVWLADSPLDVNEGAKGGAVLILEIPEDKIATHEWIEKGKGFREFLVPADLLNEQPAPARRDFIELWEELEAAEEAELGESLSQCARCKRARDVADPEEHGWQLVAEGIICPDCRTTTDIQAQIRSDSEAAARLTEQPERGES